MQKFCLMLARLCSAGWVGGAVLFVVTSVREQMSPDLDSTTKGTLALIRFPWYYLFGFVLLSLAFVFGALGTRRKVTSFARRAAFLAVTVLALMTMTGDYAFVYGPLARMTRQAAAGEVARPERFRDFHEYSKQINTIVLGLSAVAALLLCWPTREPDLDEDRW